MDSLELKVPMGRVQDCKIEIERLKSADCRLNDWRLEIEVWRLLECSLVECSLVEWRLAD